MLEELGCKRLTVNNWQEPDPVVSSFVHLSLRNGTIQPISGDDWARAILTIELSHRVPVDVRRLLAVASGALAYGYYFYPMFTLGAEQLFRVAEAAVGHKCRELGIPDRNPKNPSFADRISNLVKAEAINPSDQERWDALRKLRNLASHPEDQSIFTPGIAIEVLQCISADIEELFSE